MIILMILFGFMGLGLLVWKSHDKEKESYDYKKYF